MNDMAMAMAKKRHDSVGEDSDNVDILSNLPSSALDQILIKLPLIDAVRTSILSTNWRHKWVTIPNLHFDYSIGNRNCESIVDRVLKCHRGRIVHFYVVEQSRSADVDRWIRILLNHPVEHLSLRLLDPRVHETEGYYVFDDMYSFRHLKQLSLSCFKLVAPPSGFEGFSNLVDVGISRADVELEDLETFLSRCPMLERLRLAYLNDTEGWFLDVDAPRLKWFTFLGSFESICFGSAVVEEFRIVHDGYPSAQKTFNEFELCDSCASRSNLVGVFNQLPFVESVHINGGFLEFLAIGGVPKELPINLNHVTILDIGDIGLDLMIHITCTICLLRSCPNLESLDVSIEEPYNDDEQTIQYLKAHQMCNNVSLSQLRCVRIFAISGFKPEMEFLKLILLWATALEKLVLYPRPSDKVDEQSDGDSEAEGETDDRGDSDVEVDLSDKAAYKNLLREHKLLKKIARLPRASARAVVTFQSDL